jgi:hypothetical protein
MNSIIKYVPLIAAAFTIITPVHAKKTDNQLEKKSYSEARKIISQYGWKSYEDTKYCSSNNAKDSCSKTPELYWCKFAANCQVSFYKEDKCLFIDVKGGPRWNTYIVHKVKFDRGIQNCPAKN